MRFRSASSSMPSSPTSPAVGMPVTSSCASAQETAAVMRSCWSYGSYHVAWVWSAPSGQFRRDTVLMVIRPAS